MCVCVCVCVCVCRGATVRMCSSAGYTSMTCGERGGWRCYELWGEGRMEVL